MTINELFEAINEHNANKKFGWIINGKTYRLNRYVFAGSTVVFDEWGDLINKFGDLGTIFGRGDNREMMVDAVDGLYRCVGIKESRNSVFLICQLFQKYED